MQRTREVTTESLPDVLNGPERTVEAIHTLQTRASALYGSGVFPTRRTHPLLPYSVDDDNVFFAAATVYTLLANVDDLGSSARESVLDMAASLADAVPRYRNREGLPIYNFWQVHPEDRFFPNGTLLSRFRKLRLPEDIDTTAYVYLAGCHDRADAERFQSRLEYHANGSQRWTSHALPHHRHRRAYSTWMGDDDMPVDFDICAISNTLLALSAFGLPPRRADEESVGFIESAVTRGEHLEKPFQTAPWYGTTPVILYHLARVIARTDIGPLKSLTDRLLVDVRSVFSSRGLREMEKLLLSTAAMWLGGGPLLAHAPKQIAGELSSYPFFVASLLAVPENYVARKLAHRRLFHFEYVCPAHSMAVWVEHEVLRRRTSKA